MRDQPRINAVISFSEAGDDADDKIIQQALAILERRMLREAFKASSPQVIKQYLVMKMARLDHEVFCVLWLDVKNRILDYEEMFRGTLTHCAVYPREIVRSAMRNNAAAAIIAHVHPSGEPDPSDADRHLTKAIRDALSLVEVRLLDHIIVANVKTFSFAENGLI